MLCADELVSSPERIVSAGSPAEARAWLISESTCAAAALSAAEVALAGVVLAEAEGCAVAVPVADRVGCADGEATGADPVADADGAADADGPDLTRCARLAALCGGIVTTTGDAAMAMSDWLAAQEAVPAVPHPAVVLPARPVACPAERAPRVR
jgi:hypothetical protein